MAEPRRPDYASYLRLDAILNAQRPPDYALLGPDDAPGAHTRDLLHHDEMLFVVVHQVFELWLKLTLRELSSARDMLGRSPLASPAERRGTVSERDIPKIVATLNRVNEIFRVAADHFRVIETMHPTHFLAFRNAITPASGFQSTQFRELEILAGLPEAVRSSNGGGSYALQLDAAGRESLEGRTRDMSLKDALLDWLRRTPIQNAFPDFAVQFVAAFDRYADEQRAQQLQNPHLTEAERAGVTVRSDAQKKAMRDYFFSGTPAEQQAHHAFVFIATYRDEPLLRWPSVLLDALVEFEQNFRSFRFRHARMVERMIGARTGTGGSPGLAYLDKTADYRIFGNLLEARNFLLARDLLPDLPKPEVFQFHFES